jgi:hypothetical protein
MKLLATIASLTMLVASSAFADESKGRMNAESGPALDDCIRLTRPSKIC